MQVAFFNPQGNFHPDDLYLTEHPDFGGQLIYVKELAQAMARDGFKIDIFTRRIHDPAWPGLEKDEDYYEGVKGVRIIRIPFGGDAFLPKEELWPYLEEFVFGVIDFYQKEKGFPQVVTGHYGDGGLAGALFQARTEIPYTFTCHSPGALKMEKLVRTKEDLARENQRYHFDIRLYGEGIAMEHSLINVVSTLQERFQQYGHPAYEKFIHTFDHSRFAVIPPGVNTRIFYPIEDFQGGEKIEELLAQDLSPSRLHLPGIIAASRFEEKKNHQGLLYAYGTNLSLQKRANLIMALRGNEKEVHFSRGSEIHKRIHSLIKEHSLSGKVAFLLVQSQKELADTYRYLSQRGGIFALTSFFEPFGLAPLEALACGLPVVVTNQGGPVESLKDGHKEYGVFIDPSSDESIAKGLLTLLEDQNRWRYLKEHGLERVRNFYTWERAGVSYGEILEQGARKKKRITIPWPGRFTSSHLLGFLTKTRNDF